MATWLLANAPCTCAGCTRGKKALTLRGLAEHLGMDEGKLRAIIDAGDGPPSFHPSTYAFPRYSVAMADAWLSGRDDSAVSAARREQRRTKRGAA